jgi:hypothetical protein
MVLMLLKLLLLLTQIIQLIPQIIQISYRHNPILIQLQVIRIISHQPHRNIIYFSIYLRNVNTSVN